MRHSLLVAIAVVGACSVPQPEIPDPEPAPAPTYRDPADLPGPHPMPRPAPAEPDAWEPVDPASLAPLEVTPCNVGLAPLYSASQRRDMGLASQVHGATLGCLQAGRLEDAQALAAALVRDDATAMDAYIRARVALAGRGEGGEAVCMNDAYMSSILELVSAAADPVVSARMMTDPAFEPVHGAYRYRLAILPSDEQAMERFVGTTWYGPGQGAYGTMQRLELKAEGQAVSHVATFNDAGIPEWSEAAATWAWADGMVQVQVGDDTTAYALDPAAAALDATPEEGIADYFDFPSECEA